MHTVVIARNIAPRIKFHTTNFGILSDNGPPYVGKKWVLEHYMPTVGLTPLMFFASDTVSVSA